MRDYGKVSPKFWIGNTGRKLRGHREAQIVAVYLMTSPHSNMLGLYWVPISYIGEETGLGEKGTMKGLRRAIEAQFCAYDEHSQMVWVCEMAAYQIGDTLDPKDRRCIGVQREYDELQDNQFLSAFFDRYSDAFHMTRKRGDATSPFEAPSKPLRSPFEGVDVPLRSQEQEQEQEQSKGASASPSPRPRASRRAPPEFEPDREWALREIPDLDIDREVQKFRDCEFPRPRSDWPATWRNWIARARDEGRYARRVSLKTVDPYATAV